MQLRLALSVPKFTGSLFKQSTSAILTGVTIAGAFATVIFNSTTSRNSVSLAFDKFASLLQDSYLGSGINKLAGTFKDWGTTIVGKKDDFVQWVHDYLNVSGFKSGAVELYKKLYDWAEIVYNWFKDKFIIFIKNIPEMVQNWKKLRLSLFKWGTFLGGGGGSALWAMFGSGDNWGKLAELIGNPAYEGLLDKFANLVQENSSAFENMSAEDAQEMLEGMLEDPAEAEKMLEELAEDRKEKNKKKEEELKQENKEKTEDVELEAKEILDKLGKPKGGKPQDTQQALGDFIGAGLDAILSKKNSFDKFNIAKEGMKKHIEYLEKESKNRNTETAKVKQQFLDAIKDSKNELINTFADLATTAYAIYGNNGNSNPEKRLATIFENLMKEKFTKEAGPEEQGDAGAIEGVVRLKGSKK